MDKRLASLLLNTVQNGLTKVRSGKLLDQFFQTQGIGLQKGKTWRISPEDIAAINQYIKQTYGIASESTCAADLHQSSRAEMARVASNEKFYSGAVKKNRLAIKSLPNKPILMGNKEYFLPHGSNLDICLEKVVSECRNDSLLLIENWEVFDDIHLVKFPLESESESPLVVYRGDPQYQTDTTTLLLDQLTLPVDTLYDWDPAGLGMASRLPRLRRFITPPEELLIDLLKPGLNQRRFIEQCRQWRSVLDRCDHPSIVAAWNKIRELGSALPQELYLATE